LKWTYLTGVSDFSITVCEVAGVSHLTIAAVLKVAAALGLVPGVDGEHLVLPSLLLLLLAHGLLLRLRISSLLGN